MKFSAVLSCLLVAVLTFQCSQASAETVQTVANVFNGRPFLWLEAENYASLTNAVAGDYNGNSSVDGADYVQYRNGTAPLLNEVAAPLGTTDSADYDAWRARFGNGGLGWTVVSKENPITSVQGLPILPADSNVSGTAILDQIGGGRDTVKYEMKFITAGTYQLFSRHSMYDTTVGVGSVGNEDSVYLSPAFNKNSASDWVGFQGLDFDENDISGNVDVPNPGYAADPDGWKPSTADSTNDGWYALRDWGVKSAGVVNLSATPAPLFNGNFNWYNRPFFVGATAGGGFATDYGFKTEYIVTPDMVGQTLTFEMGTRENYAVFDGFLFIQTSNIYPNSDLLDLYTQADLNVGILPPAAGVGAGAVPEPAALVLVLIGMAACRGVRVRRSC